MIGRIQDRATFATFARGRRARCGPVRLRFVPIEASSDLAGINSARVAYAINRKVGNAVTRNRVRRRLRAALSELERSNPGALSSGSYLFSADAIVTELPFAEVRGLVDCVVERAGARG